MTLKTWTKTGLLDHFSHIHEKMEDRAFAFVLGAGASRPSGIPTGAELVRQWLAELHRRLDSSYSRRPLEEWATAANLGIPGFDYANASAFYPQVYDLRFQGDEEEGYAALEALMEGREPSFGYSVLAQLLTKTRHRVVITTNFDNLVADALSIYTRRYPLVCGHESLAGFVRARMRRPLVAKIHRDLLFGPQNQPEQVSALDPAWGEALRVLFQHYTPIVIGYGGNDGSLMGLLESLERGEILGGMLWCYRHKDGPPGEGIQRVVAQHGGALVPILGYDEFMLELGQRLELGFLVGEMEQQSRTRIESYRRSVERCLRRLQVNDDGEEDTGARIEISDALAPAIERLDNWWSYELRAQMELDTTERELIYREGLASYGNNVELRVRFANFLRHNTKKFDEAEDLYKFAIEHDPENASHMGSYANFLKSTRHNYPEAERLYRQTLELDPTNAAHTGNFANFLKTVKRDWDEAETYYRRCLELDPNNGLHMGNLATFLKEVRKKYDEADRLYRSALLVDPHDAVTKSNYAAFLIGRGRFGEAQEHVDRAWRYNTEREGQVAAEIVLYRGILDSIAVRSDDDALGRLKWLLSRDFTRGPWSFDDVLKVMRRHLEGDDRKLYDALAAAVLDKDQVAALDAFPRWAAVRPVNIAEPWTPIAKAKS